MLSYFLGIAVGFIAACLLSVMALDQKAEDGSLFAGKWRITREDTE
jgi:hypothetical protein